MKKRSCSSHGSEKSAEAPSVPKETRRITFDYQGLDCFLGKKSQHYEPNLKTLRKEKRTKTHASHLTHSQSNDKGSLFTQLRVLRPKKGKVAVNKKQPFNQSLYLLEEEAEEEKPQIRAADKKDSPASEEEDQEVTAIVNSCLRFITEDTEHSSNPISARYTPAASTPTHMSSSMQLIPMQLGPMMEPMSPESYNYYYSSMCKSPPPVRNRRVISNEESKAYVINVKGVEQDDRTTIMIRNIPNKYTQDMLLELFEENHKKKFDFFYLPIDYTNNCNVGYAFLNFIHCKFIAPFYQEFHQRKWHKFNSVKVCQVCYARIQGTAQLENHFEHSNVLQQKEKKFRPLFERKLPTIISSLVQKQKDEHPQGGQS